MCLNYYALIHFKVRSQKAHVHVETAFVEIIIIGPYLLHKHLSW